VGLRRRRVLTLGLPLWAVLTSDERAFVLGHEFGHFVNGDLRRGLIVGPAVNTLLSWYEALLPGSTAVVATPGGFLAYIGDQLSRVLMAFLRGVVLVPYAALVLLVMRTSQRAEYLADDRAARVAGTETAVSALDFLASAGTVWYAVERAAMRSADPAAWRAACQTLRLLSEEERSRRRAAADEGADVFDTHPPVKHRVAVLRSRPTVLGELCLSADSAARSDAELAEHYRWAAREIDSARDGT